MEARYVMLWNGGLYHANGNKNVFTVAELREEFFNRMYFQRDVFQLGDYNSEPDEVETVTFEQLVEQLIDAGAHGSQMWVWEEDLAERGCDFVETSLVAIAA